MEGVILFKSKEESIFLNYVILIFHIVVLCCAILTKFYIVGLIYSSIIIYPMFKIPKNVLFYDNGVTIKFSFKRVNLKYKDINYVDFKYTSPSTFPALVIVCNKESYGFEWGDKRNLVDILNWLSTNGIKITNSSSKLNNFCNLKNGKYYFDY
jgi:hypothetical protein